MIKLSYTVPVTEKETELAWLKEQQIFAASTIRYNWEKGAEEALIGMIVTNDVAMMIKLKHKLDVQIPYAKR